MSEQALAFSKTPMEERPLSPMQMRFVSEYISDGSSAKAAAIRAGYSVNTASEAASRLMADPRVRKLVQEANSQAAKTLGLSAERVLQELWKVAGANPGDIVTLDDNSEAIIDPKAAGEVMVTTVNDGKDKKVKSVTTKTIKPSDKIAALEKIAKIMNLFPKEDTSVEVKLSLSELIERSMTPGEIPKTATAEIED